MLINESLAGKKVATIYGNIEFNDKGENDELNKEQQQALGKLIGFEYVAPKPKKKEETKPKKEEAKKETTTKKKETSGTKKKTSTSKKK